jgi:hypothetical protein
MINFKSEADTNYSKDFRLNILSKYHQPEVLKLNFDKHFQDLLFNYIDEEVKIIIIF